MTTDWLLSKRWKSKVDYKTSTHEIAKVMFADTGISVTTSGAKHLGAAVG